jgi:hypothetical protein
MQKWEYCPVAMNHKKERSLLVEYKANAVKREVHQPDNSMGDPNYADAACSKIGALGLEGWEMVNTSLTNRKGEKVIPRYMFKRPILSDTIN